MPALQSALKSVFGKADSKKEEIKQSDENGPGKGLKKQNSTKKEEEKGG